MEEIKKIKKTFYLDPHLVKLIKIKSAIDETSETHSINSILSDYFNGRTKEYSFLQKEK